MDLTLNNLNTVQLFKAGCARLKNSATVTNFPPWEKNYFSIHQFTEHEIKCGNVQFWIQQHGCALITKINASSFQLVNQISLLASVYTSQNVS